jgi:hypothetical protein
MAINKKHYLTEIQDAYRTYTWKPHRWRLEASCCEMEDNGSPWTYGPAARDPLFTPPPEFLQKLNGLQSKLDQLSPQAAQTQNPTRAALPWVCAAPPVPTPSRHASRGVQPAARPSPGIRWRRRKFTVAFLIPPLRWTWRYGHTDKSEAQREQGHEFFAILPRPPRKARAAVWHSTTRSPLGFNLVITMTEVCGRSDATAESPPPIQQILPNVVSNRPQAQCRPVLSWGTRHEATTFGGWPCCCCFTCMDTFKTLSP